MDKTGLLDGKKEIAEYLGNAGERKLKTWLKAGMPVRINEAGQWLAHKDNLEKFFRHYTMVKADNVPE